MLKLVGSLQDKCYWTIWANGYNFFHTARDESLLMIIVVL
jgi:hypothetical protein